MTAPSKPWEGAGFNFRSDISPLSMQSSTKVPDVNVRTMSSAPPPLPPRPSTLAPRRTTSNAGIVGGSHIYRGYPSTSNLISGYGGYGGYGNLGMYGSGYGGYGTAYAGYPYGYQNTNDNRLVALAEERTRPAFESIESVVRAFGSVSFMLESTLCALQASFRAALGVAEHLSHLHNIFSALSIFRLLQWCLRQLRRLLGLRHRDAALGSVWGEAAKMGDQAGKSSTPSSAPSQWPLRAFIGVVISGSYLAWKLLSYIVGSGGPENLNPFRGEEGELWVQGKDPGCQLAVGFFNFTGVLDQELSFSVGDKLIIAPKSRQPIDSREWLLATHMRTAKQTQQNPPPPVKVGLVPSNYVRLVEKRTRQAAHQAPGCVVAQGPTALTIPQPIPIPPIGLPMPTTATPLNMAYGQAMMPNHPPTVMPLCTHVTTAPTPFPFNTTPVNLQAAQPPLSNTAAAGGGGGGGGPVVSSPAAAAKTLAGQSTGSDSASKPADGGQNA